MSGHSKFANIKHKKEKNDAQRGKIFTRLGREIAVAVKSGGPDLSVNSKLRDIVAKAKSSNMPNDTIERSIKKAAGDLNGVNYESIVYEGYGPNGVAVIVEILTDNRNRAAANVRNAFTKGGGNMGTTGCVSFMFDEKGLIMVEKDDNIDEDELMMLALDSGAENFEAVEEGYEIVTLPEDFSSVREAFEKAGIPMVSAEVTMIPQTYTEINNEDDIKKMNKLLALLDEEDDVQNVYHNWENEDE
ncbi:YebC/PmpR family DNA-binding transcriptional regulator [Anaeropeptidivorans aminofermentans]|jgi:YebC/PmpR family DNA-binding regulatory protein|uniref:YebC/PmpR family DNA-binding transcriptional regulator n=1 Tax=Anaeropeptidivorans aminofermentans TaxID=2934315 RepID=UPI0020241710|nr:YebC/PmpR family DNA-binding transcriptional regulator [Anaeropeptidivorans aminofermentans]MBE6013451.1 YebC/PmpR family DNA-binding transcriptional regulator [Lachnospiraceae bacterium]